VVNLEHVVEVSTLFVGAYLLRLDDKARSEIPVSRNFVPAVRASLRL
jgi:DNA-binding LytR/AlgR family response regulator